MTNPQDDPVEAAMLRAARERFLPASQREHAEQDHPLPIGHGQTSSQPRTVREMLRLLETRPGQRVLDVGCGSGWTTALLAHLVGPAGSVLGVELEPELAAWGRANVLAEGLPWARVEAALPGVLGWPDGAPYERVLVSAEPQSLPDELVQQLAPGGVMVIPVAGRMLRVRRPLEGKPRVEQLGRYRFVPLR